MSSHISLNSTHRLVWVALMAALISVGGMIVIPVGPVPISLQTMFVALAGLLLGPIHGLLAVCLFLGAGAVGLPVFAGGKAGLGVILGPTGGYLAAFILTSVIYGLAGGRKRKPLWVTAALCLCAAVLTYVLGGLRLASVMEITAVKALMLGALPFFIGDVFKIGVAVSAYHFLQRRNLLP